MASSITLNESDEDDYPLIELIRKKRVFHTNSSKQAPSLVPYSSTDSNNTNNIDNKYITNENIKSTRKRKRQPDIWKKNLRKQNYQQGKAYTNTKNQFIPEKKIKIQKDCEESCRFKCNQNFDMELRELIKSSYYSLSQNEKYHFLLQNTKRVLVKRKKNKNNNYRSFSFEYYFEKYSNKVRVCKKFFLNTLVISQKPVYNVHLKKDDCGAPQPCQRGKYTKGRISDEDKNEIKRHISSFPHVEAHYCRSKTKKLYLQGDLNLQKMYDLYVEQCQEFGKNPQKIHLYRNTFNYEFNLAFHIPKSDRCSSCEEYKLASLEKRITESMENLHKNHRTHVVAMRLEKDRDKQAVNQNCVLVCFDLENVLNLPKSEVSVLFYKQKLNVYNLTATCSNQVYCAIWSEAMSGRSGNDLASAFIQILESVLLNNPNIKEIITWSDSCVAQNKNSLMSIAITNFLMKHPEIDRVTMKYSIPGHSCVQEVDNVHSRIERFIKRCDIWSPKSFIQILKRVDRRNSKKFHVIEMSKENFMDYQKSAKKFLYNKIPYTKVFQLRFTQTKLYQVEYTLQHGSQDFQKIDIRPKKTTRSGHEMEANNTLRNIRPMGSTLNIHMTQKKLQDIKFAYRWMPLDDKQYMETILAQYN